MLILNKNWVGCWESFRRCFNFIHKIGVAMWALRAIIKLRYCLILEPSLPFLLRLKKRFSQTILLKILWPHLIEKRSKTMSLTTDLSIFSREILITLDVEVNADRQECA